MRASRRYTDARRPRPPTRGPPSSRAPALPVRARARVRHRGAPDVRGGDRGETRASGGTPPGRRPGLPPAAPFPRGKLAVSLRRQRLAARDRGRCCLSTSILQDSRSMTLTVPEAPTATRTFPRGVKSKRCTTGAPPGLSRFRSVLPPSDAPGRSSNKRRACVRHGDEGARGARGRRFGCRRARSVQSGHDRRSRPLVFFFSRLR